MSHLGVAHLGVTRCAEADQSFGPAVASSCRAFDFTLVFEHIFFSLLPAVVLILSAGFRLWALRRAETEVAGVFLQASKQVSHELMLMF